MIYKMNYLLFLGIILQVCVGGRGAGDIDGDADVEEYWPKPRSPMSDSAAVEFSTDAKLLDDPYVHKTGPLLQYYSVYSQYATWSTHSNNSVKAVDGLVCFNYVSFNNGSYIGAFTCPMPHEPSEYTACCGEQKADFCCLPQVFLDHAAWENSLGAIVFIVIVGTTFGMGAILWTCAGMTKAQLVGMFRDPTTVQPDKKKGVV